MCSSRLCSFQRSSRMATSLTVSWILIVLCNNYSRRLPVTVTTDYPFGDTLSYVIGASKAFTFNVRIPSWAQTGKSTISVNNGASQAVTVDTTTNFHAVACAAGTTKFTVNLDAPITTEIGVNNSVSVHRGALMYAIDLAYQETKLPALR
jgi:DUF1680 family protein